MRVFWFIFVLILLLLAGALGWRGRVFERQPRQVFADMAVQDRLPPQSPEAFFRNGSGPRPLPPGTVPAGLAEEFAGDAAGSPPLVFTSRGGSYFETGVIEGYYGRGMPVEVKPADESAARALLKQGKASYESRCAVCHGISGNGKGVVASYPGFPVLVDLADPMYARERYPDGRLFFVITHGLGNMTAYGPSLPVRERWGIAAWVRVLQAARAPSGKEAAHVAR